MKIAAIAVAASMSAVAAVGLLSAPAHAETAGCGDREVSVYFQANEASLDAFSDAVVARLASEAKSCRAARIVAQAPAGALSEDRANSLKGAFLDRGVRLALEPTSSFAVAADNQSVLDRAARVRISMAMPPVG